MEDQVPSPPGCRVPGCLCSPQKCCSEQGSSCYFYTCRVIFTGNRHKHSDCPFCPLSLPAPWLSVPIFLSSLPGAGLTVPVGLCPVAPNPFLMPGTESCPRAALAFPGVPVLFLAAFSPLTQYVSPRWAFGCVGCCPCQGLCWQVPVPAWAALGCLGAQPGHGCLAQVSALCALSALKCLQCFPNPLGTTEFLLVLPPSQLCSCSAERSFQLCACPFEKQGCLLLCAQAGAVPFSEAQTTKLTYSP